MRGRWVLAIVALAAAIPVLAPVAAQSPGTPQLGFQNPSTPTPVDLYFHLYNFQEFPINTQPPRDDVGLDAGVGLTTHTSSCLPDAPYIGEDFHSFYGFSSPGYVEYDDAEEGKPRAHPERQLSYELQFDPDHPPVLHWYLSTWPGLSDAVGTDPSTVPIPVPQVRVRATMRTGGEVGTGPGGYDAGTPFAAGTSDVATLAAELTTGATYGTVDGRPVYGLTVPLAFAGDATVAANTGFTLQVDTYLDNPVCDPSTGRLMPNLVRVHSSKDHRPRLSTTVLDPVRVEYLHPQVLGDGLAVHVAANSPFGNYDVNETRVQLAITGPTPATNVGLVTYTQHTHVHDRHDEAADFAFLWKFRQDAAQPGNYTVQVTVTNDQGTATATGTALVHIADDITVTGCGSSTDAATKTCTTEDVDALGNTLGGAKKSPGPALTLVMLIIGCAALRRRSKAP